MNWMKPILALTRKELQSFLNSPATYIFLIIFWMTVSWLYFRSVFLGNQIVLRDYFSLFPWVLFILVPSLTMRTWAEEKRMGTWEVLLTWPVTDTQAVLAKLFAVIGFLKIALLGTLVVPIAMSTLGPVDWGVIIASYIGALLLASSYAAIGCWASSLTKNQILAFIIALATGFILFIIGQSFVVSIVPNWIAGIFRHASLSFHYASIGRGVIDTRDIIYYLSVIAFFAFLTVRNIEARKWK